jgi:hypothetical protein
MIAAMIVSFFTRSPHFVEGNLKKSIARLEKRQGKAPIALPESLKAHAVIPRLTRREVAE